jgi:conjugative relaxase-like TrwC/TraI family protein
VQRIREEELAKTPRTAVAGFDLTFSPPKSVSAIWGVADAGTQALIAQAHHAAMRDTIAVLEQRVAATRVGRGGVAQMPIVGVIATAFDHYDSRAADPQLHTHVVVSNKVQGIDGRWRTLDSAACTRPPSRCRRRTTPS